MNLIGEKHSLEDNSLNIWSVRMLMDLNIFSRGSFLFNYSPQYENSLLYWCPSDIWCNLGRLNKQVFISSFTMFLVARFYIVYISKEQLIAKSCMRMLFILILTLVRNLGKNSVWLKFVLTSSVMENYWIVIFMTTVVENIIVLPSCRCISFDVTILPLAIKSRIQKPIAS